MSWSFNIRQRVVLDNETVKRLDELAEQSCARDPHWDDLTTDAKNARRRYLRLVKKVSGGAHKSHAYTGSGQGLVPGCTEVYFGHE